MHTLLSDPIEFTQISHFTLVIEDPLIMFQMIRMLKEQIQGNAGDFILSKENKPVAINKHIGLVTDPLNLQVSERSVINKILKALSEVALDEAYYLRTIEMLSMLSQYGSDLTDEFMYPIQIDENLDIMKLLKIYSIKIQLTAPTLGEELIEYIKIVAELTEISLFIFVNIFNYLRFEEVQDLLNEMK